jgi:tetrahydromethanopterin S-methyltransferase subunit G
MSGEELRAEIKAEAETELKKAEAEWHKRLNEVNEAVEATRQEVKTYMEKTPKTTEEESE